MLPSTSLSAAKTITTFHDFRKTFTKYLSFFAVFSDSMLCKKAKKNGRERKRKNYQQVIFSLFSLLFSLFFLFSFSTDTRSLSLVFFGRTEKSWEKFMVPARAFVLFMICFDFFSFPSSLHTLPARLS